jgi:hypothetical protein
MLKKIVIKNVEGKMTKHACALKIKIVVAWQFSFKIVDPLKSEKSNFQIILFKCSFLFSMIHNSITAEKENRYVTSII